MRLKPADYVGGFFEGCAKVLDFARIVKYEENESEKRTGGDWKWGLRIRRENSFLLLPPLPSFVLCPPRQLVAISFLFNVRPLFANHRWKTQQTEELWCLTGSIVRILKGKIVIYHVILCFLLITI